LRFAALLGGFCEPAEQLKDVVEWRGRLQANYRRRRSARQQRIARPGALIGTDP
jgi:hypothetical protein